MRDLLFIDLFLPQKCDMCGNQEESCQSRRYSCLEVRWLYVQILAQSLKDKRIKNRNDYFVP